MTVKKYFYLKKITFIQYLYSNEHSNINDVYAFAHVNFRVINLKKK